MICILTQMTTQMFLENKTFIKNKTTKNNDRIYDYINSIELNEGFKSFFYKT